MIALSSPCILSPANRLPTVKSKMCSLGFFDSVAGHFVTPTPKFIFKSTHTKLYTSYVYIYIYILYIIIIVKIEGIFISDIDTCCIF